MPSQSEEALKAEIARLSGIYVPCTGLDASECLWLISYALGAINAHKSGKPGAFLSRSSSYVNPNYKPPPRPFFGSKSSSFARSSHTTAASAPSGQPRDVVIDGVAFQSSQHSLVRKDRKHLCLDDQRIWEERYLRGCTDIRIQLLSHSQLLNLLRSGELSIRTMNTEESFPERVLFSGLTSPRLPVVPPEIIT